MSAPLAVTLGLHCYVELVDKSEAREGDVHALRFIEGDAHVLDEMINEETWVEITFEYTGSEVIKRPARCGATPNCLEHCFEI